MNKTTEVLVVGGGPVGMYAALELASRGLDVWLIDQNSHGAEHSYALALHPESLRLFDEAGLARELVAQGQRIERMAFYEERERSATVDFSVVDGPFAYVLVVPQMTLEDVLRQALAEHGIRVRRGHQAMSIEPDSNSVQVEVARMEKESLGYGVAHTEASLGHRYHVRAKYVVGADGYESFVRRARHIGVEKTGPTRWFAIFEFLAEMGRIDEARVVLSAAASNVLWPISPQRGRWSFEVPESQSAEGSVDFADLLSARAPWFGSLPEDLVWSRTVRFDSYLVDRFGEGRIWLAGDAAHGTGPVGVQSMNVGLGEAHDLAECISATREGRTSRDLLRGYDERWRREWRSLFGLSMQLAPLQESSLWIARNADRLLPCIPASGAALLRILAALHLDARSAW